MDLIVDCQNKLADGRICARRTKYRNFESLTQAACGKCGGSAPFEISEALRHEKVIDRCPVCAKSNFYIQRDFPQQAGCLIVMAGAVLVPWTYGLSLAVVAIIDFILYRFLPDITVCYHCLSKIRGVRPDERHKPFDHNLFEQYLKEK